MKTNTVFYLAVALSWHLLSNITISIKSTKQTYQSSNILMTIEIS